ncbi:MAG: lytic transglycosylase domain-containing protein [Comamonadaceae bacterium]|nr:MAG: lytic transglycosylase domain-containing protein [Comamonadaceae bacterium]
MAAAASQAGGLSTSALGSAVVYQATGRAGTSSSRLPTLRPACELPGRDSPQALLIQAADAVGVDRHLVSAVAWAESAFRADAVSPKGAMGLMQLMPGTARQYGVADPFDPWQNVQGGTRLLRDLLNRYAGDTRLALAAYNAGAGAVERAGQAVPNYPETQTYVAKVLQRHARLRGEAGLAPLPQPAAPRARAAADSSSGAGMAQVLIHTPQGPQMRGPAFSQRQIGNALLLMPGRSPGNLLAERRP